MTNKVAQLVITITDQCLRGMVLMLVCILPSWGGGVYKAGVSCYGLSYFNSFLSVAFFYIFYVSGNTREMQR